MAKGKIGSRGKQTEKLVFDPKERVDYVKGFSKRKQERKKVALEKAKEKDRQVRLMLRKKRREALKRPQSEQEQVELQSDDNDDFNVDNNDGHDDIDDDEDDTVGNLKEEDYKTMITSQQPATIKFDGQIEITPFNMEEELEEGELDKAGNFVFRKKEEDSDEEGGADTWAESVDWAEVRLKEQEAATLMETEVDEDLVKAPSETKLDKLGSYKAILRIIKPEETVQKAIRRLGNGVPKRKPRRSRLGRGSKTEEPPEILGARQKLDHIIELAHNLLEQGDTDIYQKTYEEIEEAINN